MSQIFFNPPQGAAPPSLRRRRYLRSPGRQPGVSYVSKIFLQPTQGATHSIKIMLGVVLYLVPIEKTFQLFPERDPVMMLLLIVYVADHLRQGRLAA